MAGSSPTRERILEAARELFNTYGESHTPTGRIADELDISPGNLHYHFRTKAGLVDALFGRFERRMLELLSASAEPAANIEDIWLFLHLVFENIVEYRFFYRDLADLCARHAGLERRFRGILKLSRQTARGLIDGLRRDGRIVISDPELDALTRNILLVATFWLAFDAVYETGDQARPDRAVWQVMSLVSPYLAPNERAHLDTLASAYIQD